VTDQQRQQWPDAIAAHRRRGRGSIGRRQRQQRTGLADIGPGRIRIPAPPTRGATMSDDQADIAFVRYQLRNTPGAQTYKAIPRAELDTVLAEPPDGETVESCDIVLPIPSVAKLADDLAATPQGLTAGVIGTVAGGVWITGPLAGHDAPRGFEWYE
jgi:hypothetical protein